MVRQMALLVGSLIFAVTCAPIPWAPADDNQSVRTESGRVRCYVGAGDRMPGSARHRR